MAMIFCGRCDTWAEDLIHHQDNGECELIQKLRDQSGDYNPRCKRCAEKDDELNTLEKELYELQQKGREALRALERMR